MRNILSVNTKKSPYELGYVNNACNGNIIELDIYVNNITNPILEFTLVNGTVKTTDILPIENNIISYEIPFSYYSTNGTLNMRLLADNYSSEYIGFSIPSNISSSDDVIVKKNENNYLIKTVVLDKYYDLPIASETQFGAIKVGENLTIKNGVLSSNGGGLAATIEVGTTTTGAAGSNASVTNSGTSSNAVFNFVIPRGVNGTDGTNGIDGEDGREIEMQVNSTHIQWRYVGDTTWNNLLALSSIKGEKGDTGATGETGQDGEEIQLQATDTYIQWKYTNDTSWTNLIALSLLKGEKGDQGVQGIQGVQGVQGEKGEKGDTGERGLQGEQGIQGIAGADGITPNIQVGTTTTLSAGSKATVTQRGTAENPIFDFGIPKGIDGTGSVKNLVSEDSSNPICLYDLEEGIYAIYGYIKYYPTYSGVSAISSPTLTTVSKSSTTTYIQFLEPYGNKVTGYEITETNYKEITNDNSSSLSVYEYTLTKTGNTLTANGWRAFSNTVTTTTIPAGKYLVLYHFSISGSGSAGVATVRPMIDGNQISSMDRQTVSVSGSLTSTSSVVAFTTFSTDKTHTLSSQCYSSVSVVNNYDTKVELIKIA